MSRILPLLALVCLASADLLAYWDFQTASPVTFFGINQLNPISVTTVTYAPVAPNQGAFNGWPATRNINYNVLMSLTTGPTGGRYMTGMTLNFGMSGAATSVEVYAATDVQPSGATTAGLLSTVAVSAGTASIPLTNVQVNSKGNLYLTFIAYGGSSLTLTNVSLSGTTYLISCGPPLTPPANGYYIGDDWSWNATVTYACNPGYTYIGDDSINCKGSGAWTPWSTKRGIPRCQTIVCADPGVPTNGARDGDVFTWGGVVMYSCAAGFVLSGDAQLTCGDAGWSAATPSCIVAGSCGDPGAPANGVRTGSDFTTNAVVTYSCPTGTLIQGAAQLTCGANNQWSAAAPTCIDSPCPDPLVPANGQLVVTGTTAAYTCNTGYTLSGAASRTCTGSSWSDALPTCVPSSCGQPPVGNDTNLSVTATATTYNGKATYSCATGYRISGQEVSYCSAVGTWTGIPPKCVLIDCGALSAPDNGTMTAVVPGSAEGSQASFACDAGFVLTGSDSRTCNHDGVWTGADAQCNEGAANSSLYASPSLGLGLATVLAVVYYISSSM